MVFNFIKNEKIIVKLLCYVELEYCWIKSIIRNVEIYMLYM